MNKKADLHDAGGKESARPCAWPASVALAAWLLAAGAAHAQQAPDGPSTRSITLDPAGTSPGATPSGPGAIRGIEAYASHSSLTAGFPDWRELGVRGSFQADKHVLQGELARMTRWGEYGTFIGLGDTYTFNDDWYGSLSVGAGDGVHYLPRYRIDGFVHRKLLAARNLVADLGAGYYRAPDGHVDRNVSIGATYYAQEHPFVVQGEIRFTHGSPGSVDTQQYFVAATWGRDKQTTVTGRIGWGEEGYQSIGENSVLTNFNSQVYNFNVRHWFGPDWGMALGAEHYRSPTYLRTGLTAGLFWQLP